MNEMNVNPAVLKEGLLIVAEAFSRLADAVGSVGDTQSAQQVQAPPMQQPVMVTPAPQYAPQGYAQPQMMPSQSGFATSQPVTGQQVPVMNQPVVPTAPVQQPVMPAAQQGMVPTTAVAQEYTQDQLAVACAGLVNQGKQQRLMQILQGFGVAALTDLPKERYGELATAIRAEGAVI